MSEKTEDTAENRIIELAKEILLKFITDKLGGQKAKETVKKFLDEYTIRFDPKKPREIPGTYYPQFKTTVISAKLIKGDMLETLGTIIHELGHVLSDQIATGEKIGKPIEEGFADIITEESLTYFFKISPEKMREFAISNGLKYRERNYTAGSDYIGEGQFLGAILETIRQKTGKHYEAEFEYLLGDKNKFLEIVRETLGDSCVELIMQQKDEKANVGSQYDANYNKKLAKILEAIPLRYETVQDDEETRIADREDGTRNVYRLAIIKEIAKKQELAPVLQKIKRQLKECKDIVQVKELLQLEDLGPIILENVDLLFETENIKIEDIFEIIGSDIFETDKFRLTDEQIKQLEDRLPGVKAEELSPEQINGLIKIGIKINKPNQQIHDILSKVEKTIPDSLDMQIGIGMAKIKTDKEPKGQDLIAMLEYYCNAKNETEISDECRSYFPELYDMTDLHFDEYVQKDPGFLRSIASLLRKIESKATSGKELSGEESIAYLLRQNYFEFIKQDIRTLKELRDMSDLTGFTIELEGIEQVSAENILGTDLESKIKISPLNTQNPLTRLLFRGKEIKTFDLFNKNTIAQCIEGRLCESAEMEFKELNEYERRMYLEVFVPMLEVNPNEIPNISAIKQLCKSIMPYATDKDQEQDNENKSAFVQVIKQNIRQRKNPIMDLIEMYKSKIPTELRFIYDETMRGYREMVDGKELREVPESLIRQLILTASSNTEIKGISTHLLANQFADMGLTTGNFMQALYEERKNGLYYQLKGEQLEQWLNFRTTAYMESIGKSGNKIQQKALTQLQSRLFNKGKVMHAPQYIEYKNMKGINDFVIVGREQEHIFTTLTQNGDEIESDTGIVTQQNKGKKGIIALFKKKRDREIVAETIVVGHIGDTVQAINRYETGRFEMVSLSMKKSKVKVLTKQDIEPQDIGNNGSLVVKKPVVDKINMRYGYTQQRDSQQLTIGENEAKVVETEEEVQQ